ncbi:penicillin-binding transpeptidase domain-containing protein [Nocardiopsis sp. LOL_012]|uniref:penicillin-binding transpeptidase domain-containing protein n=1 Tax=Nocardiopsis sp. LOL_012 TaxID=3345409 RepID=UPI003A8A43C7
MSPRPLGRLAAAGSALTMAVTLAACTPHPSPEVAVRSFLLAWQDGDHARAAAYTTGEPAEVEAALSDVHDQLDLAGLRFGLGPISRDGDSATAEFSATADLGIGDPTWEYTGAMPLEWGPDGWRIAWSPSVIHPDLGEGERLAVSYEIQARGQILDRDGVPLVTSESVTAFGVYPGRMDDPEAGVTELAELLGEEPGPLLDRVRSAPPEQFQPLVLMRGRNVDTALLEQVGRISGVDTQAVEVNLTPAVAPAVLGEVAGTAEHRVSSRVPGTYQAGDTVGLSGLQNIYQNELAGSATTQVVSLDDDGEVIGVLESWQGDLSGEITTTLDAGVQSAAEEAVGVMPGNGYVVAVDVSSGELLASAAASGDTTDNGGLTGSYKPGGAFTIVSALAALQSGAVGADTEVPCGFETEIDGERFTNPHGQTGFGDSSLSANLAVNCAVGFADLGAQVGPAALTSAAADLGLGTGWQLPLSANAGEVAIGGSEAEVALAMNGEHGVLVSPLGMALAAAAVADGTWHAPTLVSGQEPETADGSALDPGALEAVRQGMGDAVAGRMSSLNGPLYGEEQVYGQAARTEQGETSLHWFVGYQGGVAFAVLAEVDPARTLTGQYAFNAAAAFLSAMAAGEAGEGLPEGPLDQAESTGDPASPTGPETPVPGAEDPLTEGTGAEATGPALTEQGIPAQ